MHARTFLFVLAILPAAAGCSRQQANAVQIEQNGAVTAENVAEDADDRAGMLAAQAEQLNREANAATGTRRDTLRNEAEAAMSAADSVERSAEAAAARIDGEAERRAQNATGR